MSVYLEIMSIAKTVLGCNHKMYFEMGKIVSKYADNGLDIINVCQLLMNTFSDDKYCAELAHKGINSEDIAEAWDLARSIKKEHEAEIDLRSL